MKLFKLGILLLISSLLIISCQTETTKAKKAIASISPTNLVLSALIATKTNASINLKNTGDAELNFTLTDDASWLTVNKTSGTVAIAQNLNLVAEASCATTVEVRKANISISSNGGDFVIPVSLDCSKAVATQGKLVISISGLASGLEAKVTVTGDNSNFSQTLKTSGTLDNLEPDTYTVKAESVSNSGDIYLALLATQNIVVSAGTSSSAVVEYLLQDKEKGSLDISILGLRLGIDAKLELVATNGASIAINSSQLISNLDTGSYTLKAKDVVPDSATFAPDTNAQNINIEAGKTQNVLLNYHCTVVNPPDANLKAVLQSRLSKSNFNCNDLASLDYFSYKHMGLENTKIRNLEGLQYAINLERFAVTHNLLTELPVGIFDNMPKLEKIFLGHNQITTADIPTNIFAKLPKLKTIALERNKLTSLPSNLFNNNKMLEQVYMSGNQISSLPNYLFANLPILRHINLSGNQLSSFPANLFQGSNNIKILVLDNNKFSSITNQFAKLNNLENLSLFQNLISHIDSNAFDNLGSLTHLSLGFNKLDEANLNKRHFLGLTELYSLNLDGNMLKSLAIDIFDHLKPALKLLSLKDNLLDDEDVGDSYIFKFSNLVFLDLANNRFNTMNDAFFYSPKLEKLKLSNNNIYDITKLWINTYSQLNTVNLNNNCIKTGIVPSKQYISDLETRINSFNTTLNPRPDCDNYVPVAIDDSFYLSPYSWKIISPAPSNTVHNPVHTQDEPFSYISTNNGEPGVDKPWYFRAGEYYYGDASGYAGGLVILKIRHSVSNRPDINGPLLILKDGSGKSLEFFLKGTGNFVGSTWTDIRISLYIDNTATSTGVWKLDGNDASNDDIRLVLSNLKELLVRASYHEGGHSDLARFFISLGN